MIPKEFRAWCKDRKMIISWELLLNGSTIPGEYLHRALTDSQYHIMQWTGLKDKNGKKIFEGDIVKGKTWKELYAMKTFKEIYLPVVFSHGEFTVNHWDYEKRILRTIPPLERCEVVGNIWENPELLEDE